eukprot:442457-Rhodomonas_salina.4
MRSLTTAAALVLALDLGVQGFSFVPQTGWHHGPRSHTSLSARGRPNHNHGGVASGALRLRAQSGTSSRSSHDGSESRSFAQRARAASQDRPLILREIVEDHNAVQLVTDFVKLTSPNKRKIVLEVEGDPEEIFAKLRKAGLADQAVLHFKDAENTQGEYSALKEQAENDGEEPTTHPSYFKTSLKELVVRRSGVLTVLLLLQSVSSLVLTSYSSLIEQHVFLALFLTMLTGTGGNAGNQSSALVIRGLSTGEIHKGNSWLVIARELMASSAIAFVLASAAFTRVLFTQGCSFTAALIISVTTFITVVGAIAGGTVVPLLLDRLGFDPVHLSSPILATLTDVMGVLLLCVVATSAMGHL